MPNTGATAAEEKTSEAVIELTKALISRESVTPNDAGCQQLMAERLQALGFANETMVFHDTTNLWSRRGKANPVFCFAGHTDVVPAGELAQWHTPPFEPVIKGDLLYGRGAADMKGSLAAMIVATERFVRDYPDHQGSIAYLITSDEEGPFINGTTKVIDTLEARNEKMTYCIVGEPSSSAKIADVVKNGRRGSISGELVIRGKQGHVAYPEHVDNPIHQAMPALAELSESHWDDGNDYFPETSFQLTNIQSGTGATNVVPGQLTAWFNLRFSTELDFERIMEKINAILTGYRLDYDINWTFNGKPFITKPGALLDAVTTAIKGTTGREPELSTSGGTSDGRFIAPTGAEVIELGPLNATIHQVNECVSCADLKQLTEIYYQTLVNVLAS
ncbi:succinyl-diaminopimelate desuccinylase [Thalassomonas actiniarum]|uniref:Succinyl-diaminopimelate desuccinylase n=1 Tax=Thalassomonas actiniarum TaxID=485447 RepID=A0AAE9YWP8_9GAMM|nr:succinyl-diaminopimelate desuccinylase [Thalassomonas actiniarum]WDE01912.1 succinyl-diaminopimelate desuccinylase [Thalassomonas actiniarum]